MKRRLSYDKLVRCRVHGALCLLVILYLLLGARLFYIQVVRAPFFKAKSEELTVRRIPLPARRGAIFDRSGVKLAETVDAYDIYVQPVRVKDKKGTADRLSAILNSGGEKLCDRDRLLERLESDRTFVYIARRIDVEIGEKVRKEKLPGTGALRTMKRIYPRKMLACHLLGFVNVDGAGMEGVEKSFDEVLRGTDGWVTAEVDAKGRVIPGTKRERVEPIDGKSIILTIDSTLQHTLESALEQSYKDFNAVGASAVMMEPNTGNILALANMPRFDPNDAGSSDPASRRNRALTDLYEPGSTQKAITACAVLDDGAVGYTDRFMCKGSMGIGRRTIRCSLHGRQFANGHGSCDVAKMLKYSCNIAAASMGMRLGAERLYSYEEAFGLYEKPGTGLPGEIKGWHDSWKDWQDIRLANIAFGQGIALTPVQLTRAYCAIANGGNLMRPLIVKEILGSDGKSEKVFEPLAVRRVVSEETARAVSKMLIGVVDEGTGKSAQVEGYKVAGKTGSAQKASTTGRGYAPGKFIASFVGFLPVTDPRVVILVAVDEPKGSHFGATVAAPVFQKAALKAMWHMRIAPDDRPPSGGDADPDEHADDAEDKQAREHLGG